MWVPDCILCPLTILVFVYLSSLCQEGTIPPLQFLWPRSSFVQNHDPREFTVLRLAFLTSVRPWAIFLLLQGLPHISVNSGTVRGDGRGVQAQYQDYRVLRECHSSVGRGLCGSFSLHCPGRGQSCFFPLTRTFKEKMWWHFSGHSWVLSVWPAL